MKNRIKVSLRNAIILLIISVILGSTINITGSHENILEVRSYYILAIFMNLIPIAYFILKYRVAKKYPLFFIGFVFYYLIILPIWSSFIFDSSLLKELDINKETLLPLNIITGLNIFLLLISQIFILKYVFIDIVLGHRKAKNSDIIIVFLTYITIGITFGFIYVMLVRNDHNAISGILLTNYKISAIYIRSIYFSFITLTSVGYGEILPVSLIAQILVTLESILGVLLLSFSLGIVFSSHSNNSKIENQDETFENKKFKNLKKRLMKEFEESLDKNLKEITEKEKE